jgi:hypothetical protein
LIPIDCEGSDKKGQIPPGWRVDRSFRLRPASWSEEQR